MNDEYDDEQRTLNTTQYFAAVAARWNSSLRQKKGYISFHVKQNLILILFCLDKRSFSKVPPLHKRGSKC